MPFAAGGESADSAAGARHQAIVELMAQGRSREAVRRQDISALPRAQGCSREFRGRGGHASPLVIEADHCREIDVLAGTLTDPTKSCDPHSRTPRLRVNPPERSDTNGKEISNFSPVDDVVRALVTLPCWQLYPQAALDRYARAGYGVRSTVITLPAWDRFRIHRIRLSQGYAKRGPSFS